MHQFIPLLLLPLVPFALGQYGDSGGPSSSTTTTSAPASTTSSSSGSVHTVTVGANGLLGFSPNTTTAAAGSTVEFHFFPQTHSVVQGSFSSPCAPLNATSFYSGGMATSSGENVSLPRLCPLRSAATSTLINGSKLGDGFYRDNQRHLSNLVLLRIPNPLPNRHGWRHQPTVSSNLNSSLLFLYTLLPTSIQYITILSSP
jgi:plastocyanin